MRQALSAFLEGSRLTLGSSVALMRAPDRRDNIYQGCELGCAWDRPCRNTYQTWILNAHLVERCCGHSQGDLHGRWFGAHPGQPAGHTRSWSFSVYGSHPPALAVGQARAPSAATTSAASLMQPADAGGGALSISRVVFLIDSSGTWNHHRVARFAHPRCHPPATACGFLAACGMTRVVKRGLPGPGPLRGACRLGWAGG